mmetsp:Transcript_3112/g.7232  ORF Transcript_3112/g.7232 Transcript_3112/m.7232 type:complete len:244 (+) Transcript_3112:1969-2700(+)
MAAMWCSFAIRFTACVDFRSFVRRMYSATKVSFESTASYQVIFFAFHSARVAPFRTRTAPLSSCAHNTATSSGDSPFLLQQFMSAFASTSSSTKYGRPYRTATCRGASPARISVSFTSARVTASSASKELRLGPSLVPSSPVVVGDDFCSRNLATSSSWPITARCSGLHFHTSSAVRSFFLVAQSVVEPSPPPRITSTVFTFADCAAWCKPVMRHRSCTDCTVRKPYPSSSANSEITSPRYSA